MGQKVHPIGFRLGYNKDWHAKWFAEKQFTQLLHEDLTIRKTIKQAYPEAGIAEVDIERSDSQVTVTVHTSRPGIIIGRGGQRVDETRARLERATGKRIRLNIQEIRLPETVAYLVARNIADQLEKRVAFRRAMRQAASRTIARGVKGVKIISSGRLGGAEMARREKVMEGQVPLHTLKADIDYGFAEALTTLGRIGVKVWIYKGDIQPQPFRLERGTGTTEGIATE
ncbi:MAG: 30S ribosomal protein S3 [Chloroflexi bacterium]|nr:30S ribosomal protein S3 [Chloroflexota bacterium]